MKTTKIYLDSCIPVGNAKRQKLGLTPIESIRALGRKLAELHPELYDSKYIISRLHRANRNGIKLMPVDLVKNTADILCLDENYIITPPWQLNGINKPLCNQCKFPVCLT